MRTHRRIALRVCMTACAATLFGLFITTLNPSQSQEATRWTSSHHSEPIPSQMRPVLLTPQQLTPLRSFAQAVEGWELTSYVAAVEAQQAQARAAAAARAASLSSTASSGRTSPTSSTTTSATSGTMSNASTWACIRQRESGGNYAENSGNGYYGAYQFLPNTWNHAVSGAGYPQYANGRADLAPPNVQDAAAQWLQSQDGWQPWSTGSSCGV